MASYYNGIYILGTVHVRQLSSRKFRVMPSEETPAENWISGGDYAMGAVKDWCRCNCSKSYCVRPLNYRAPMMKVWASTVSFCSAHDAMLFKLEMAEQILGSNC